MRQFPHTLRVARTAATAGLTATVLILAGCSSSTGSTSSGSTSSDAQGSTAGGGSGGPAAESGAAQGGCEYDATVGSITVTGRTGSAPAITVDPAGPKKVDELIVKDLCDGEGDTVTAGATVTADYKGVAMSTGAEFDSSYEGDPALFPLSQVIPGWSQGLPGMKEGGTRLLVIPGELAYGSSSPTPDIGPNETLIFVVDMVEAVPAG